MTEDDPLPPEARSALEAYQAMSASKSEYFGLLQQLDVKYKERGSPTIAENLKLEKLLQTHGERVASFNNAMQAVTDKERPLADIAQSLGFAEPSAFCRAFRRWTGTPPARWRRQQTG